MTPEVIAAHQDDEHVFYYVIKEDDDMCRLITSDEAIEMCPMSVIDFYERQIVEQNTI